MLSLIVFACVALLPAGTPFIPLLGFGCLWRCGALQLPALPLTVLATLAAFGMLILFAASLKGAVQFGLCLSSFIVFVRLAQLNVSRQLLTLTATIAGFSIGAILLHAVLGEGAGWMFAIGDHLEVRYRFLFSEPNILMSFVFFPAIACNATLRKMHPAIQVVTALGLAVIAAAGGSPFGYVAFLLFSALYLAAGSTSTRLVGTVGLALVATLAINFIPPVIATRLTSIASGDDNSLNFRTWGSIAIAQTTLADRGDPSTGIGIGNARAALDGNPYLVLFAAEDASVLPNFIATLWLETGIVGLSLIVLLWLQGFVMMRREASVAAGFLLVVLNCCTSSFFLDYFSWAAMGLCFGMSGYTRSSIRGVRQNGLAANARIA
jgi:hypothetical protein